jgi:hypothetical protein
VPVQEEGGVSVRALQQCIFYALVVLTALFMYWTVQAIRKREIKIPLRGGPDLWVTRQRNPVGYWMLVAFDVAVTALALGLVVLLYLFPTGRISK